MKGMHIEKQARSGRIWELFRAYLSQSYSSRRVCSIRRLRGREELSLRLIYVFKLNYMNSRIFSTVLESTGLAFGDWLAECRWVSLLRKVERYWGARRASRYRDTFRKWTNDSEHGCQASSIWPVGHLWCGNTVEIIRIILTGPYYYFFF